MAGLCEGGNEPPGSLKDITADSGCECMSLVSRLRGLPRFHTCFLCPSTRKPKSLTYALSAAASDPVLQSIIDTKVANSDEEIKLMTKYDGDKSESVTKCCSGKM
ncbi:hypothetical protein ANN_14740 [Periplaneta americana]|uniref:Uncharacterized protein n=1 Tax=Periplaneta americana TaxID=6978 RepID=A0ABQ8SX56_PERAM|nr:hypothetical protein ANN_14740 [Periplaneta americana]